MAEGIEIVCGVVFTVFGLSFLLNPRYWADGLKRFSEDPNLLFAFGFPWIVGATLVVVYHNLWTGDWRVLVTLVGWLALVKSVVLVVFPTVAGAASKLVTAPLMRIGGIGWLAIGVVILYFALR